MGNLSQWKDVELPLLKLEKNWTENHSIHTRTIWYKPSGLFKLRIEPNGIMFYFRASAIGNYYGIGVSCCLNSSTGATRLIEKNIKKI